MLTWSVDWHTSHEAFFFLFSMKCKEYGKSMHLLRSFRAFLMLMFWNSGVLRKQVVFSVQIWAIGATLDDWYEHIRGIHWFHWLFFLPVLSFRGFRQAAWFSTTNTSWGHVSNPQPVHRVLYQSIWPSARAFVPLPLPSSSICSSLCGPLGNVGF